jgi:serine/threonine-protein phosphatase 4 regulatory subunit 1
MDGMEAPPPPGGGDDNVLRFEDLTIDDDLPLLERVVRYCRSGIALQRLVHVKMLAETAETVG